MTNRRGKTDHEKRTAQPNETRHNGGTKTRATHFLQASKKDVLAPARPKESHRIAAESFRRTREPMKLTMQ